jgi:tripartite-type tricarboxylate transporter receptor subunit TctC
MPGAGGLIAANHLFNNAPQDGTFMSVIVPGVLFNQLFKEKGVRFDGMKLHWIGNPIAATAVSTVFHTAPVKTWRDALSSTVLIGATGPTGPDAMVANLANSMLGTKLKVITGYKGGQNIALAMESGEVHGRGTQTWAGWKATNSEWVSTGKLIPLWQIGRKPDPELPDVPLLHELVSGADDRAIVLVYANVNSLGRPFAMGPRTSPEIVETFRRGFDALMQDEAFRKEALKIGLELGQTSGEEIQAMVGEALSLDDHLASRLQEAIRN